jgi:hypothetical protein
VLLLPPAAGQAAHVKGAVEWKSLHEMGTDMQPSDHVATAAICAVAQQQQQQPVTQTLCVLSMLCAQALRAAAYVYVTCAAHAACQATSYKACSNARAKRKGW